jgi:ribonuclease P protein component
LKQKGFSFGKNKRLVSDKQFKAVLARSLRVSNGLLTLYMAENDCGYPRLGISVKKSCGNAVVRNRLKRILREAFRQNQDQIPAGFDYLLMISPPRPALGGAKQPTFGQVKNSFLALVNDAVEKIK